MAPYQNFNTLLVTSIQYLFITQISYLNNTYHYLVSEDNVIYRAFGKGIEDQGIGNKWHYNLVAYVIYEGLHLNQPINFDFHACFQMEVAFMPEMIGNIAAGCERAGIMTEGEPCDTSG